MTQRLTMYQVAGLGAVLKAAGAGEAERPKGVHSTTLYALLGFGLVAQRQAPRGRARRGGFRRTTTLWRMTEKGRALLGSPDPAAALLPALVAIGAGAAAEDQT